MVKHLNAKYANITSDPLRMFTDLSIQYQEKCKCPMTTGTFVQPILSKEFCSHGSVNLIDMQPLQASNNLKWIMVYQDHLTKFCVLRPLY